MHVLINIYLFQQRGLIEKDHERITHEVSVKFLYKLAIHIPKRKDYDIRQCT